MGRLIHRGESLDAGTLGALHGVCERCDLQAIIETVADEPPKPGVGVAVFIEDGVVRLAPES